MKTTSDYEKELRSTIKSRTGTDCEPWLIPQLRATTMNMVMLDKLQEELLKQKTLVVMMPGSMKQQKMDAHPLLAHYDKLQRTLLQQFEALGLNFRTTPSKVKEDTKRGVDEEDPMAQYYNQKKS
jgi:hypothetical protein